MRIAQTCILTLALAGVACSESEPAMGSGQNLGLEKGNRGKAGEGAGPGSVLVDAGQVVLECPRGGAIGAIHVEFACNELTVYSCKDLSNVVLEFEDGTRQRFEGLSGGQATFSGTGASSGSRIVGVWVKAGNNSSGDGPGYGERFDAPDGPCTASDGGMAGSGGTGGAGDEDPCLDNDPDTFCGEGEPDTAGNGGDPIPCAERPGDPACNVD